MVAVNARGVQPLYLLADSQLLFWKSSSGLFLASILEAGNGSAPNVAYIGASNGDSPEAYSIFTAALEQLEIRSAHWVRASFSQEDRKFLETADVVVLAGGDVEAGWNAFTRTGMREIVETRYREGAVLVGVSAGAVQLGTHALAVSGFGTFKLIETFGLIPLVVDVHDEQQHWQTLANTIHLLEGKARGAGIPRGGGLIAHPDGSLEPIRNTVDEFTFAEGKLRHAVLQGDSSAAY